MTPVQSIREFCLKCAGGSKKAVRECAAECPLHPFRLGKNPNRAGIGPERGPRSSIISSGIGSRVPETSARIDAGDKERGNEQGPALPASKRQKIIRALEAIAREIQAPESNR